MDSGHGSLTGLYLAPRDGLLAAYAARPPLRSGPPSRNAPSSNLACGQVVEPALCPSAVRIRSDEQWIAVIVH